MKNKYTFFTSLFFLFASIGYAQFGPQQVISTEPFGSRSTYAADLDGDGDMDVLSASEGDYIIAWYENLDGLGSFGSQQIIFTNLEGAKDVLAEDLDGDGDMDVLAAGGQHDRVVWFENLDGMGNFGIVQIITSNANGAISVFAIDLDGDNDKDVLSASSFDNKVAWYENTDGLGTFGSELIISNTASSVRDVIAADLDGDGDMDVLAAEAAEDKVLWFENTDGLGTFGLEQVISNNVDSVLSVFAIDIDGDEDIDVLSASPSDDKVAWYENLDGLGNFGVQQVVSTGIDGERLVFAADLDNDGDNDILSGASIEDNISWYENLDGLGNFSPHQTITTEADGPRSIYAADLDGDGDMDVLSASIVDDKIAWYENLTILGTNEFSNESIILIPNPVSDILTIDNSYNAQIESIKIYDVLGRLVLQEKEQFISINVSQLNSGLLFVQLETEEGIFTKKVVKE